MTRNQQMNELPQPMRQKVRGCNITLKAKEPGQVRHRQHTQRMSIRALMLLGVLLICMSSGLAQTQHPNMFLNQSEIDAIKAKVQANQQPWRAAYDALIADANRARSASGYYSVTKDGGPNNGHNFYTENPYCGWKARDGRDPDCRDGQINDQQDRQDYEEAIKVGRDVRDLGLAYALTGEASYADRAVYLIRRWALDSQTYMSATSWPEGSRKIEVVVTLPGMFYGADLIYNYAGWPASERTAFLDWVRRAGNSATQWTWADGNNLENWRTNYIMAAGALANDQALRNYAYNRYRELIPSQINSTGQMTEELRRTNSLSYSLYAINAMTQTAEIARHFGVDLYEYTVSTSDTRGLKRAFDYYQRYCVASDPRGRWEADTPYEQIEQLPKASCASYELAYARWGQQSFLDVINRWGRPLEETRIMGPVTLTHARGTYPFSFTGPPLSLPIRIEAGSLSAYTDAAGNNWRADTGFTGGNKLDRGNITITGTNTPRLYQTERYGMSGYAFAVPDGTYLLTLHFAETYSQITAARQRLFSIEAEGQRLVTDLDVYTEAGGRNRALIKPFTVNVTDGQLNISFIANVQSPIINAIEIVAQ